MPNKTKLCPTCRAVEQKPVEDLTIELAGIVLAPTLPVKGRKAWFRYWFKKLQKEVEKHARHV